MLNNRFLKKYRRAVTVPWRAYQNYAEAVTGFNRHSRLRDVAYWRKKLFALFAMYFIPVSFIALVPGVWMSVKARVWGIACVDIISVLILSAIVFSKQLTLGLKKVCVVAILYFLAVTLITILGLFGPGMLYLFGITVFMSVMFSRKYAYLSVAAHIVTCTVFGILFSASYSNGTTHPVYELGVWIAFSSNLVFLSLVSVMLITSVIGGLEKAIITENQLNDRLGAETKAKDVLNAKLFDSVSQYKALFFESPQPMWVADPFTLQLLQANDAALRAYGYNYEDFTALSIRDIRCDLDIDIMQVAESVLKEGKPYTAITRHRTKAGHAFPVEVSYNVISYHGKKVLLGMAKDITDHVEYVNAIEHQNKKLMDIAFMQSHLVRRPLARIMGLTQIIRDTNDNPGLDEELNYLSASATELDDIIRKVIENTERNNGQELLAINKTRKP